MNVVYAAFQVCFQIETYDWNAVRACEEKIFHNNAIRFAIIESSLEISWLFCFWKMRMNFMQLFFVRSRIISQLLVPCKQFIHPIVDSPNFPIEKALCEILNRKKWAYSQRRNHLKLLIAREFDHHLPHWLTHSLHLQNEISRDETKNWSKFNHYI